MIIILNHQITKSQEGQQVKIGLKQFINQNMNPSNMKVSLSKMISKDIIDMEVKVVKEIEVEDIVQLKFKDKIV